MQIELPDFECSPEWWTCGGNLYLDHFGDAGFIEVPPSALQEHDVLLMQNASPVLNHSAVYLGGGRLLQHCQGHLIGRIDLRQLLAEMHHACPAPSEAA